MARKALNLTNALTYDGSGTGLAGAPIETNAKKIDDNLAELFLESKTKEVVLAPNATSRAYIPFAGACTISGIRVRRITALATGTITLAVQDEAGNTLLSTATIDATALTAAFVAQTLTAVTANLAIAAGKGVVLLLVSNSAGSTGGPVYVEIATTPT